MIHKSETIEYLKRVEDSYDRFADLYNQVESSPEVLEFNRFIISLIEPLNKKKVLDAGCGPGIFAHLMAEKGAHVVGIDISSKLLEIAIRRCKHFTKSRFLKADIESINQSFENKFDVVLSAFEIMYHNNLTKVFEVFNSVLRNHGKLLVLTSHPVRNMAMHKPFDYYAKGCYKERWSIGKEDEKYHYTLEDYVNTLIYCGFSIKKLLESKAPKEKFEMYDKEIKFPYNSVYPQGLILLLEKIQ